MKTLVIIGHPNTSSFCNALANHYAQAAQANGAEVEVLDLATLQFDPHLHTGFQHEQPLEPDLQRAQRLITWSDHICIVTPTWWGSMPALLKGFIDRVFLPGFAFKYRSGSMLPEQLLKGRSGRLILTTDTPPLLLQYFMGDPSARILGRNVLQFCGVRPVRASRFGPIRGTTPEQRTKYLNAAEALARKDHRRQRQSAFA